MKYDVLTDVTSNFHAKPEGQPALISENTASGWITLVVATKAVLSSSCEDRRRAIYKSSDQMLLDTHSRSWLSLINGKRALKTFFG